MWNFSRYMQGPGLYGASPSLLSAPWVYETHKSLLELRLVLRGPSHDIYLDRGICSRYGCGPV